MKYRLEKKMIDLTLSGLPLQWDEHNRKLAFGQGMDKVAPALRTIKEMSDVLFESENGFEQGEEPDTPLYYMYRDLHLTEHRLLFREEGIRYDVTVLIPGTLGKEYIKTAGHYHPFKPGASCTYPEIYEVLQGRAHYLMQKPRDFEDPSAGIDEVIAVAAEPGDKVLIPPGFGHITINKGSNFLVMSNLVADDFNSIYGPLREMGGAGYFEIVPEGEVQKKPAFVPNHRYPSLPPLCFTRPVELTKFFLSKEVPQYRSFIQHRQGFDFLTSPENYEAKFKAYLEDLKSNSW
mgnify:FL=1